MASSLARPPALRMTCASPSLRAREFRRIKSRIHARENGEAAEPAGGLSVALSPKFAA